MLPYELVLVRHGQSEGNAAKRKSERGDNSAFTDEFRNLHSSSFRLTELGVNQAKAAGEYITKEFYQNGIGFDRYITSEYLRAMETAGELRLPHSEWYAEYHLRERDWGELDNCPEDERAEKFGEALHRREVEPFFWRPPNGESFADLSLRVDRVLHTLHRECADKRVIIVCHGEVMWAFRVRIERMSQQRFKKLHLSKDSKDRIHNCQLIHYTRRNPTTGKLAESANWFRMIRPAEKLPVLQSWETIVRPKYTSRDLLKAVDEIRKGVV